MVLYKNIIDVQWAGGLIKASDLSDKIFSDTGVKVNIDPGKRPKYKGEVVFSKFSGKPARSPEEIVGITKKEFLPLPNGITVTIKEEKAGIICAVEFTEKNYREFIKTIKDFFGGNSKTIEAEFLRLCGKK